MTCAREHDADQFVPRSEESQEQLTAEEEDVETQSAGVVDEPARQTVPVSLAVLRTSCTSSRTHQIPTCRRRNQRGVNHRARAPVNEGKARTRSASGHTQTSLLSALACRAMTASHSAMMTCASDRQLRGIPHPRCAQKKNGRGRNERRVFARERVKRRKHGQASKHHRRDLSEEQAGRAERPPRVRDGVGRAAEVGVDGEPVERLGREQEADEVA